METTNLPQESLKTLPALGVTAGTYCGLPLSDWVYIVTIIYTTLQIGCLVFKLFKKVRKGGKSV